MAWYNFWKNNAKGKLPIEPDTPTFEQKQYTTPELISGYTKHSKFSTWNTEKAIREGLKVSAVFAACVRVRAESMAQVPWKAVRIAKDGTETHEPSSPLQLLINKPNPDFSWSELMEMVSQYLDLAGNAYFTEIRAGNKKQPVEIWPMMPQGVKIKGGTTRLIDKYEFQYGGVNKTLNADDVIQIKNGNPADFLFGMPTIEAAARAVDIDRDAGQWQKNSLNNRGVSDYAIILDPSTSPEQYARIKEMYAERMAGPENARKPFYTTKDVKMLNQNAVEMDFVNSRGDNRMEICTGMGVPPPMVGILADATLANIETCRRIFWLDTLIPLLNRVQEQLTQQLASEFGPEWALRYDVSNVQALQEGLDKKLDNAGKLWSMGVPLSTIDKMLDLAIPDVDKIPGADVGYIGSTLLPTTFDETQPAQNNTPPPTVPDPNAPDPNAPDPNALDKALLELIAYGDNIDVGRIRIGGGNGGH